MKSEADKEVWFQAWSMVEQMPSKLCKHYYNSYGNLKLPTGYKDSNGENLYTWLSNQKVYAKTGKLDERKKQLISEMGAV